MSEKSNSDSIYDIKHKLSQNNIEKAFESKAPLFNINENDS